MKPDDTKVMTWEEAAARAQLVLAGKTRSFVSDASAFAAFIAHEAAQRAAGAHVAPGSAQPPRSVCDGGGRPSDASGSGNAS